MPQRPDVPPPLIVSCSLAGVQALVLAGIAVAEVASIDAERVVAGATTAVFFGLYAAVLAFSAWSLSRAETWARGPVLITQLIQLGVAWNFRSDAPLVAVLVMVVAAVVAILGVVHPASMEHLSEG